jgi:Cd2+/Zn2+-exporting ATPase
MQKYLIKNVDCASCAAKIEQHLKNNLKLNFININLATSTLETDFTNLELLNSKIKEIEPEVEAVHFIKSNLTQRIKFAEIKNELLTIISVLVLFFGGIIFREQLKSTPSSIGEYSVFIFAYLISGYSVLFKAIKNIVRGKVFDEHFLMSIATLGALAIGELPEAVAVMLFYNVGEFIQSLTLRNSRASIKALLEIKPDFALVIQNGKELKTSPDAVEIGDIIKVKSGDKIPLDGVVIEGEALVDTYPLTGESMPSYVKAESQVLAGTINKNGLLLVRVTKNFEESAVSKLLELVENAASRKAETEKFITTFAKFYTPIIVILAFFIAIIPPLVIANASFEEWIYRALVILVISCPCALVISIPLGYFGGIGAASRKGILVKGSNYIDLLTKVKTVVFDKTGTLTKGTFKVTNIEPSNGFSKDEILMFAAIAEYNSNHPVARSIKAEFKGHIDQSLIKNYIEVLGKGVIVQHKGLEILAGNDPLLHEYEIEHQNCTSNSTVVHVAINRKYAGFIIVSDEPKEDSGLCIEKLKSYGIDDIRMFTGDNHSAAQYIAQKLGITKYYAGLLPQDKITRIERIIEENDENKKVAFVGDGINDAPVLARSDVGFAMGALGSDAAIEAADIVLMTDSPSKVAEAVLIARDTRKIVWQNILFAFAVKLFFILLGGMGEATMWEAVFADMGVAILAILNSTRLLSKHK